MSGGSPLGAAKVTEGAPVLRGAVADGKDEQWWQIAFSDPAFWLKEAEEKLGTAARDGSE